MNWSKPPNLSIQILMYLSKEIQVSRNYYSRGKYLKYISINRKDSHVLLYGYKYLQNLQPLVEKSSSLCVDNVRLKTLRVNL